MRRRAEIEKRNGRTSAEEVAAYLPGNYRVVGETPEHVLVEGADYAGWTMDGYVLPRLSSGLHFGREIPLEGGQVERVIVDFCVPLSDDRTPEEAVKYVGNLIRLLKLAHPHLIASATINDHQTEEVS